MSEPLETFTTDKACRCGFTGEGEHPCHSDGYRCRKPAKQRMQAYPAVLSGHQMKLGVHVTYACDECWATHTATTQAHEQFLAIIDTVPGIGRIPSYDQRKGGLDYDDDLDAWVLTIGKTIYGTFTADDRGDGSTLVPALAGLTKVEDTFRAIQAVFEAVVPEDRKKAAFLTRRG